MKPSLKIQLISNLKFLKLSAVHLIWRPNFGRHRKVRRYAEFFLNLTELEMANRLENGCKRRIRDARFPLLKPLRRSQFEAAVDAGRSLDQELLGGQYIKRGAMYIFLGRSGTGKTHLATALGDGGLPTGVSTGLSQACALANELIEARNEKVLSRVMKRYAAYGLLVIDELGYVPFSKEGAELFFQVLADRHEKKSVIITTNLGLVTGSKSLGTLL